MIKRRDLKNDKLLQNVLVTDILTNCVPQLEKQHPDENAVINFCQANQLTTSVRYPVQKKFLIALLKIAAAAITAIKKK